MVKAVVLGAAGGIGQVRCIPSQVDFKLILEATFIALQDLYFNRRIEPFRCCQHSRCCSRSVTHLVQSGTCGMIMVTKIVKKMKELTTQLEIGGLRRRGR